MFGVATPNRGDPVGGVSRLIRWGLAVIGLGSAALALWLFVAPFRMLIEDPTLDPLGDTYIADCSPAFRQLVAPPSPGRAVLGPSDVNGIAGVLQPNHHPLCQDSGRARALSSLGFAGTSTLAFALALKSRRSTSTSPQDR